MSDPKAMFTLISQLAGGTAKDGACGFKGFDQTRSDALRKIRTCIRVFLETFNPWFIGTGLPGRSVYESSTTR